MNIVNEELEIDSNYIQDCECYDELEEISEDLEYHIKQRTNELKTHIAERGENGLPVDSEWLNRLTTYKNLQMRLCKQVHRRIRKLKKIEKAKNNKTNNDIAFLRNIVKRLSPEVYQNILNLNKGWVSDLDIEEVLNVDESTGGDDGE